MSRGKLGGVALVLFLSGGLAACGEEDRTQTRYTPSIDRSATAADDTTPLLRSVTETVGVSVPPASAPSLIAISLLPAGEGSPSGDAVLAGTGRSTSLSLRLREGFAGHTYAGAVHHGRCAGIGPPVASLVPATADSFGVGASYSNLPVPLDSLLRRPHVIAIGVAGRPEACGELTGGSLADAAAAAPAGPRAAGDSLAPGEPRP